MRRKPGLWLPLPLAVDDAPKLAAYLRQRASIAGPDRQKESPQRMLLAAAELIDDCAPRDPVCLRGVVDALDARIRACPADDSGDERRYWESIAHAVARVADSLAGSGG